MSYAYPSGTRREQKTSHRPAGTQSPAASPKAVSERVLNPSRPAS